MKSWLPRGEALEDMLDKSTTVFKEDVKEEKDKINYESSERQLNNLIDIIQFIEKVLTKLHGISEENEFFKCIEKEFRDLKKYSISILLLTDDGKKLWTAATSKELKTLYFLEKTTGLKLKEYKNY